MKTRRVWNRRISQQRRDCCMNMGGAMHGPSTGWFLLFYGRRFSIHSWGVRWLDKHNRSLYLELRFSDSTLILKRVGILVRRF